MNQLQDDYRFLACAFVLAQRGRYTVAPNPMVGAVIVVNGEVVGEGWHQRAGEAHAEPMALAAAGSKAKNSTVYVTLEPCNHRGRTGPCALALIDAGVSRVVIAAVDVNPQAAGGTQRLREAGIQVEVISGWPDINRAFNRRVQEQKPFVTMKLAKSLDGRTAMASGESQWITGPEARYQGQKLRAESCAIITGINSIINDDSRLSVRPDDWLEPYPQLSIRQPLRVVLDSRLKIPSTAAVLTNDCLVVYSAAKNADVERVQQLGVKLLKLPRTDGGIDLEGLLTHLVDEYECNQVLVEAGATLSGAFVQQGLVDEMHIFTAGLLMGSDARPLLTLSLDAMNEAIALNCVETRNVGNDIWQIYRKSGD